MLILSKKELALQRGFFEKVIITAKEFVSIQVFFLAIGSKLKKRSAMIASYH